MRWETPVITSGIVPGFPVSLPPHLEQAWHAIVQKPQAASITALPDGGVRVALKKQPKQLWALIGCLTIGGALALAGIWLFDKYQRSPDYDLPFRFGVIKLYLLVGMMIGIGGILALIQAAGGGERDTIIEASRGRLKIDRYIAGDHVIREYAPSEIGAIWVDSGIGIDARLGPFSLAIFTPSDVQVAVAEIIGTVFWSDDTLVARNVKDSRAAEGTARALLTRRPARE